MSWVTLETTARGGVAPNPDPALRIITRRSGYLNVAARKALFDSPMGLVRNVTTRVFFEEDEDGRFSIRDALYTSGGCPVSKSGRVTVTSLTNAVDGPIPVTLQLAPCDEPGRLVITGVKQ